MLAARAYLRWLCIPVLIAFGIASQGCGGGGSSFTSSPPPPATISVAVSPSSSTVLTGQSLQLSALVSGSTNQTVTWSIDSATAGNSLGSISATGSYAAPAVPPTPNTVTVRATSNADSTKSATAVLTINNPLPALTSISPSQLDAGSSDTLVTLNGTGFNTQSVVQLDGSDLATTFVGTSQLTVALPSAQMTSAGTLSLAVVNPAPGGGASAAAALKIAVVVSVLPVSATTLSSQTQQFTAGVLGSTNQNVTWSIDGAGSGNATAGTIDAAGLYTAPTVPPVPNTVTIRATSALDSTRSAAATVSITNPVPSLTSVSPASISAGQTSVDITVGGTNFTPQSTVQVNGTPLSTTFVSVNQLSASLTSAQLSVAGTYPVTVVTPAPGGGASSSVDLNIIIAVSVSPGSSTALSGETRQFTATVYGSADQSVTWSIDGAGSGNATVGTIDSTGLYTAPSVPPTPNTVTVRAAANADSTKSATAVLTINNPVPVLTSISPSQVDAGSADTTLSITGTSFNSASVVNLNGSVLTTTFVDSAHLTATAPSSALTTAGDFSVTVVNPSPGGGASSSSSFSVLFVISITPASGSTLTAQTQQFTATVNGAADQTVTWTIDGAGAGNATVGAIDSAGLYTAPAYVPASPNITVRATSNADTSKSATASLTITSILEDWPKYRRDLSNTGRSAETLIYSGNVRELQTKWKFTVDSFGGTARVSASPAVATVGGIRTVYVGAWSGFFYAINADTGAQIWRFEVPRNSDPAATHCTTSSSCRIASSAAVENGIVYFGAEDAYLYALDAATGALLWKQQLGDAENGAEIWSSPAVYNGVVFVGLASHSSAPCVVGKVAAFNAADGTPVWSFDTIDQTSCSSGTCLGAGIWSSPAIDEQFGTLWIGTGNAGAGCVPSTSQATRYPDGILALNSSTGVLKSFYQTLPNDTTDSGDVGATPALHTTQVVDQCTPANDVEQYWISVPSKDNKFWTAPRDVNGFLANPVFSSLDGTKGIASPAAQPFVEVQSCASGKTITTTGNHLYVPTSGGAMLNFRQDATPSPDTPAFDWQTQISSCGTGSCPLFSAPASVGDLIFFGGGDGNFYAMLQDGTFTDGTGARIFSFGTSGLVASGPAISHGLVIFGSYDGNVYCLSLNGQ